MDLASANVPPAEMEALQDLYTSTDGDHWRWVTPYSDTNGYPWNFAAGANPCTDLWQGITCANHTATQEFYHITSILLIKMRMIGTLPDTLNQLTKLEELYLEDRFIHGTIPDTLGDLTELKLLHIEPSRLSGTLPPSLGQLSQLTSLVISYSFITGTLPQSWGQLSNLTYFEILASLLTGTVPNMFDNMPGLLAVVLSGNYLNGTIPSLANSNADLLQSYLLYSNEFSGTLPPELTRLPSLRPVHRFLTIITSPGAFQTPMESSARA